MRKDTNISDVDELDFENPETCPNCGTYVGSESTCPNCGAILYEEDEFNSFEEDLIGGYSIRPWELSLMSW